MKIMDRDVATNMGVTDDLVEALEQFGDLAVGAKLTSPVVAVTAAFATALYKAIEADQVSENGVSEILAWLWETITP
jgi:hypothetical protein